MVLNASVSAMRVSPTPVNTRTASRKLVSTPTSVAPSRPVVGVVRLPHAEGLGLPAYQSAAAAGMDLAAACEEAVALQPGERALVPTGLILELPAGHEGQVRPRSGLALKHGISLPNTPGTIDSDYRGELKIIMINLGPEDFAIARGDRIAQLVLAPVVLARWEEVAELDDTARGAGGFGSTGGHARLV